MFDFLKKYPGHEWARRGSSGHETSGKLIAVAFSRLQFLMVRGQQIGKHCLAARMLGGGGGVTPPPLYGQWHMGPSKKSVS